MFKEHLHSPFIRSSWKAFEQKLNFKICLFFQAREALPQIDDDFGSSEDQIPPLTSENLEILKEPKSELLEVSEEDAADLFNLALEQGNLLRGIDNKIIKR